MSDVREQAGGAAAEPAPRDPHPLADPVTAPDVVRPVMVPRWVQIVVLPLAIVGAWALARAAGPVLLLFIIAALIALLLNPFVTVLQRARVPRTPAVFIVLLSVLTVFIAIGTLLADPIGDQVSAFRDNVPEYVEGANDALEDFQGWLDRRNIDVEVSEPGQTALQTVGDRLTEGSTNVVELTRELLTLLVEASLALILLVVLAIYMLLYGDRIGAGVRSIVPRGDGTAADDFPLRIQHAVFGYVRGQLLFSTIMGASAGIMLYILGSAGIFPDGKTYALFFGAFYGFAELIPYVGPAIGAAPPVLIALFGPEPLDALWLTIAFTALQQIEGHIVAPNVFAQALRINPILVIFALLMGGQLFGIIGAFVALPIAAMLRETVVYFRRHLVLEPWPRMELAGVGGGLGAGAAATPAAATGPPCPDCGTRPPSGAAFCPCCGTGLDDPDATAAAAAAAPG